MFILFFRYFFFCRYLDVIAILQTFPHDLALSLTEIFFKVPLKHECINPYSCQLVSISHAKFDGSNSARDGKFELVRGICILYVGLVRTLYGSWGPFVIACYSELLLLLQSAFLEYDWLSGFLGRCYGEFLGSRERIFWFHSECLGLAVVLYGDVIVLWGVFSSVHCDCMDRFGSVERCSGATLDHGSVMEMLWGLLWFG